MSAHLPQYTVHSGLRNLQPPRDANSVQQQTPLAIHMFVARGLNFPLIIFVPMQNR